MARISKDQFQHARSPTHYRDQQASVLELTDILGFLSVINLRESRRFAYEISTKICQCNGKCLN